MRNYTTTTVTGKITQQVLAAIESSPGITTNSIYERYGFDKSQQAIVRQVLIRLINKREVLRAPFASGMGKPYAYFPKTAFGRMKMDAFIAQQYGDNPPKRTYTRRAAPSPRSTTTTEPKREYHSTTSAPALNGAVVQGLVRIALPDGTHDVPVNQARQIKDELVELFG